MPDINRFLLLVVCFSCVLVLVRFAGHSTKKKLNHWVWISLIILAVVGTTYLLQPGVAGWVGAVFWFIFILLPGMASRYMQYLLCKQVYTQAVRVVRLLTLLQPFDNWKGVPEIVSAFGMIQSGDLGKAEEVVNRHQDVNQLMDRVLQSFYLVSTGQFAEYLRWLDENFLGKNLEKYPELIPRYIQALGEVGRYKELVTVFLQYREVLSSPALRRHLMSCRLFLFAFNGRIQEVKNLFLGPLKSSAPEFKAIWLATALQAAGYSDESRSHFDKLRQSRSLPNRLLSEKRIGSVFSGFGNGEINGFTDVLTEEGKEVAQLIRFGYPISFTRNKRSAYATYGILLLMAVVFLLEVLLGGSTDTANLIRMGAMVKTPYTGYEWWRPISSLFLHFGLYHFLLNSLALFIIAPFAEKWLGKWRLLFIFLASGIAANFIDVALYDRPYVVLVGASGAIMGVLGVTTHLLFIGVSQEKSQAARKSLTLILYILVFQIVLDLFTPRVSLRAHLLGFTFGILLSTILYYAERQKK